ncbi:MAG TPA: hypothetical protein DEB40_12025 [Elusimicrobia bacterium]|nr:hypothetical protein [Elusimicrobiota bacterium]HBT62461.1 hypothetical protein [Elusimicrobiota bacterium]
MRFWVYINGEVPGSFSPEELSKLSGFSGTTLVCPAEGEILEKNWRRAGEFSEIMPLLAELSRQQQPPPPAEPPAPADVDKLLDNASHRLFSHVAELMKELENRREEKALVLSLQRQIMDLKDQLLQAREQNAKLETNLPRLAELEASQRQSDDRISSLEATLHGREDALAQLRMQLEKTRGELETAKRRFTETANDLTIRNRLVDKLSRDLTEKEVSLAKALSLIRRLEEDLNRICPDAIQPESREQIQQLSTSKEGNGAKPSAAVDPDAPPRPSYTTDEPRIPANAAAPLPEQPAAQTALTNLLKKLIPRQDH